MSKCQAGDCEIECAGEACGCIAESDNPENCRCICPGGDIREGFTLEGATLVDVQTNDLPLFEISRLFNALSKETIVVPVDRMNERVSLNINRKPLGEVLNQLDLETREGIERDKCKIGSLLFLGGFAAGALLFGLFLRLRE